jgi:predicted HTH transcriptional regulator
MISLMPQECTDRLQNLFGLAYSHLSKEEQIILGTAQLEGFVTNTRLQSILELHSTDIGHILAGLVEKNMLVANKKGRWTSYVLNEEYIVQPEQLNMGDICTQTAVFRNKSDQLIYNYIIANRFITTRQVMDITHITSHQGASIALGRLINAGLVEKVRVGKQVIYQLKK